MGAWLTTMWMLLWGEATVGNLVGGVLAATLVLVAFPPPAVTAGRGGFRPWWVARLLVWFAGALVVSSVTVALAVIDPRGPRRLRSGIVAVPLRTTSRRLATVVSNLITLTPGTLTVEALDPSTPGGAATDHDERGPITLFVHALSLERADDVRADVAAIEELVVRSLGSAAEVTGLDRSAGEETP